MPSIGRRCGAISVRYTNVHSGLVSDEPYPAVRLQIGISVALPACGLCIMRRLYFIANTTTVTTTQADVS